MGGNVDLWLNALFKNINFTVLKTDCIDVLHILYTIVYKFAIFIVLYYHTFKILIPLLCSVISTRQ